MDWQLLVAAILVAASAVYLLGRAWRTWMVTKRGCGGGCGCDQTAIEVQNQAPIIPVEQITLRRRS